MIAPVVAVVVIATLAISAIIPGIAHWLDVTDVIVPETVTPAPPGILTGIDSQASN